MRPRSSIVRCDAVPVGESLAKQEFAAETDVNVIMNRYRQTGVLPQIGSPGVYGDFTTREDYLSCMIRVRQAEEAFALLPAEIRDACGHDPAELVDLVVNPARRADAERLGLVEKAAASSSASSSSIPAPAGTGSPAPAGGVPPA